MNPCAYRHSLGVPGKGVHVHVAGVAVFDVIGTLLAALLIALVHWRVKSSRGRQSSVAVFFGAAFALFVLGEILHFIFCVDTAFILFMQRRFNSVRL